MTDEELIERLHNLYAMLEEEGYYTKANTAAYAADRLEALVRERDGLVAILAKTGDAVRLLDRAERLEAALRRLLTAADGESYAEYFSAIEDGHAALTQKEPTDGE